MAQTMQNDYNDLYELFSQIRNMHLMEKAVLCSNKKKKEGTVDEEETNITSALNKLHRISLLFTLELKLLRLKITQGYRLFNTGIPTPQANHTIKVINVY